MWLHTHSSQNEVSIKMPSSNEEEMRDFAGCGRRGTGIRGERWSGFGVKCIPAKRLFS